MSTAPKIASLSAPIFLLVAFHAGLDAPPLSAQTSPSLLLDRQIIAQGFERQVALVHAGDGSGRLFTVELSGVIGILEGSQVLPTPFLDISSRVLCCGEQGLLGLAFHPRYLSNGLFYVDYIDLLGDTVVAEYRVSAADPDVADPTSERIVLQIDQPFANHNGGNLAFGPDGYLYISSGDGGSGGDPNDNAQSLGTLLGKMLRIDVDARDPGLAYGIPLDNPFVGTFMAREEIWAYGLRNPWRFSFDRETGDLFIGDVGQNTIEEIDYQPAASPGGENYGWRPMEGSLCFNPPTGCEIPGLVLPIFEYDHTVGFSITGGYRYRGRSVPQLRGVYLYGDFSTGKVFGSIPRCDGAWESRVLLNIGFGISAFGEDEEGEVYLVRFDTGPTGTVGRLVLASGSGGPALDASPWPLDFGNVLVGQSASRILTLTNSSTGVEAVLLEALTPPANPDFFVDLGAGPNPCASEQACLAPGESCTLEVTFSPSAPQVIGEEIALAANSVLDAVPFAGNGYVPCTFTRDLVLAPGSVSTSVTEQACQTLTAGNVEVQAPGGDLRLVAGTRVALGDGFSVALGARLVVGVDPLLAIE